MARVLPDSSAEKGAASSGGAAPGPPAPAGAMTAVTDQMDHTADRPSWDCRACGRPWPCDPARERMMGEMDRVQLAIFMWTNLDEAVRDMPKGPPAELFERFVHWTH